MNKVRVPEGARGLFQGENSPALNSSELGAGLKGDFEALLRGFKLKDITL